MFHKITLTSHKKYTDKTIDHLFSEKGGMIQIGVPSLDQEHPNICWRPLATVRCPNCMKDMDLDPWSWPDFKMYNRDRGHNSGNSSGSSFVMATQANTTKMWNIA